MSFLTAEWRKLALANYVVDPKILDEFVPAGTELDLYNNKCFVSLVGFMFVNTKLMGFKIPFHTNFEEVNLRFYVKRYESGEWKRGVVFIKEIVPKHALTFVANTIYHENYETMSMHHDWNTLSDYQTIQYQWKKMGKWNSFKLNAEPQGKELVAGSEAEFITEHYWGYARINERRTNEYEVTHPKWLVSDVLDYQIDVNYGTVYGNQFAFLDNQKPHSVMLAEGSEITVEKKRSICV